MATNIIAPETKHVRCLILNSVSKELTKDEKKFIVVDCSDLMGEDVTFIVSSSIEIGDIQSCVGKLIDVTYKECIAGYTQYIDDSGLVDEIKTHEIDHKQFVSFNKTNPINLLMTLNRLGLKDLYEDLKELND